MTVVVPAVFSMCCGLRGNSAVKWASRASSRYPAAGRGEDEETARPIIVAAIEPASRTIPATITQRDSLRAVRAPWAAASLGHDDPVAAVGSDGEPGELGWRAPARLRHGCSRIVLTTGPDRVIGARVRVLAAGQAPWAAYRLPASAADPEPGRVVPAADAQLDGVRQQAGHGHRAPPGACGRGSGPSLAGGYVRVGCGVLDEPCGEAIAAWPAGQVGFLAFELAFLRLNSAR